jgi:hypothetical protein
METEMKTIVLRPVEGMYPPGEFAKSITTLIEKKGYAVNFSQAGDTPGSFLATGTAQEIHEFVNALGGIGINSFSISAPKTAQKDGNTATPPSGEAYLDSLNPEQQALVAGLLKDNNKVLK